MKASVKKSEKLSSNFKRTAALLRGQAYNYLIVLRIKVIIRVKVVYDKNKKLLCYMDPLREEHSKPIKHLRNKNDSPY